MLPMAVLWQGLVLPAQHGHRLLAVWSPSPLHSSSPRLFGLVATGAGAGAPCAPLLGLGAATCPQHEAGDNPPVPAVEGPGGEEGSEEWDVAESAGPHLHGGAVLRPGGGLRGSRGPWHSPVGVGTRSWWDLAMAWAPLLLAVLAHTSGSLVQAGTTQPASKTVNPGDNVDITCSGGSADSNGKYWYGWYQQKTPGTGPVTVIYSNDKRPSGIPSRFSASTSGSTNTLNITGVQAEDEAVYYCGGYSAGFKLTQ
uniref:Ig-like domain-containing protein n=1 Tax=Anas zonorhyncha TaxID=75864 RepID=A0A8B9UKQ0_9AVES